MIRKMIRKEIQETVDRFTKYCREAGITGFTFEKLTEEDRKIERAIAKERGWKVIEDE